MGRVVTWARTVGVAGALILGWLGSAAAVRVSGFPGPPAEADAVAAAVTAIGRQPIDTPGPVVVCDYFCPDATGEGVVSYDSEPERTDVVAVTYHLRGTGAAAVEAAARSRLAAQGWRAAPRGDLTRGGLVVGLQVRDTPDGAEAIVVAAKATPVGAKVLAVAGFLLGAALGWLLVRAADRRFRRHSPARRALIGIPAVVATAVTLGYATLAVMFVLHSGPQPAGVELAEFVLTVFPSLALGVGAAAALALTLVALPPRRGPAGLRLTPPVGHTGDHGAARS
ncbi:hypothetical protein [Actinoplanes sp. NPDC049599]|uniref:hypothetical protein n=1 Tax=Actinoplanes sp. NPDC049599 TaxID=3363903 RepID=UPI0037A28D22